MKSFTVLSHNVFWFQGVPFPSDAPPEPDGEIVRRLCAFYRALHPDVICLQEIQCRETFAMVAEWLGMAGCYCPGTALPQYGGAVFWRLQGGREIGNSQNSAVTTQRMWQLVAAQSSVGDVRICNIHLPSERQLGPERAAAQRIAELEDAIRSCRAGLDIIAGDFNEQPEGPIATCLASHGYLDAAVRAQRVGDPTNIGGRRGDYIWIARRLGDCLPTYGVAGKQQLACADTGKQYLSDHLPLWTTLKNTVPPHLETCAVLP